MDIRKVLVGAVVAAGVSLPAAAQQKVQIDFWHGLAAPLGPILETFVKDFNESQPKYQINAGYKGSYPDTMQAAIAAFRSGTAPHIVQMFEVGTGTMMAAGAAVKPLHELLKETGVQIDFDDYLPAVRGYYSLSDGRPVSMPFNSSTAVLWYNKDAFKKAGLDPENPPKTWPELFETAKKLKDGGVACPYTTAWPTWLQVEQFSAVHNIPLATKGNGFQGLDAELRINNPLQVRHLANLVQAQKDGTFKYGGRDNAAEALFPSAECAMITTSSGFRGRVEREAKFAWGVAMLPYYPDAPNAPINSIIGGASFWVMNKGPGIPRNADELRGVAEFFKFLSAPDQAARWHMQTGYLPLTRTAYEMAKKADYYQKNAGAEIPIQQLLRGDKMTENSMGIRLGGFPEIRNIIQEEMERALQGQQTPEQAMQNAAQRGNTVLRNFERANRRS
ncbi:MAG TPA: sn-glycerol-3-phosphate ABC transporter substrate-binding protein UgpB [Azospirillaceae bacterium]|nr:sn-glycerol-3-phosphate ABC transporter substrate-binding protein UgpB [Azospirillaceae bacterium]